LRFRGTPVEVQNYIDDLGVQVGRHHRRLSRPSNAQASTTFVRSPTTTRFDYFCWDLYSASPSGTTRTSDLARRNVALHDLEAGGNETSAMGTFIAERIVRAHLATMAAAEYCLRPPHL
jgi:arginyl-tRNA synthetase